MSCYLLQATCAHTTYTKRFRADADVMKDVPILCQRRGLT